MQSYIQIDGWKSNIRFSSAHLIAEYEKCGRLHGHTYAVNLKVCGEPDKNGVIIDFSLLKNILKSVIKELDHKVLIPKKSSLVKIEKKEGKVKLYTGSKQYILPLEDCVLLPISSTSVENLAQYILGKMVKKIAMPKRIKSIELGIDEGFGQGAWITKKL